MRIASARDILTVLLATIAGFLGGRLIFRTQEVTPDSLGTVRATRFELLSGDGVPVAFWGTDEARNTVIQFIRKNDHQTSSLEGHERTRVNFFGQKKDKVAAFGVSQQGSPFLNLAGKDGISRAILYVTEEQQKPALVLSDEKWEGRILLGFIQSDYPSPAEDDWGLLFRAPSTGTLANIGVVKRDGKLSGIATIRGSGKTWTAP